MFKIIDQSGEISSIIGTEQLFDYYRLVDPATNIIYKLENGTVIKTDLPLCYKIWEREKPCENCISYRSYSEDNRYVKIEYFNNIIYLITTRPVIFENKKYSLELISDVTNSMYFTDAYHQDNKEITSLIKEINNSAVKDSFTNIYNNKFIKNKLKYFSENSNEGLCFMIMDIDNLKNINNNYGHLLGDNVIIEISKTLNELQINSDIYPGRMGGDEFAVIFKDTTKNEAEDICHLIKNEIENKIFNSEKGEFKIEITMGICQIKENESYYSFVKRTENEMYFNKKQKGKGL
ncbi:MAG: GGDEF domain-containing protein [Clostridia bacterium]